LTGSGAIVLVGVSLSDDIAVFGAPGEGLDGKAYSFDLNCSASVADLTGGGTLGFFDVSAFLAAFAAGSP